MPEIAYRDPFAGFGGDSEYAADDRRDQPDDRVEDREFDFMRGNGAKVILELEK